MQKSDDDDDERVGLDFFYLFEDDENLNKTTSISSFFCFLSRPSVRKNAERLKKQRKPPLSLAPAIRV